MPIISSNNIPVFLTDGTYTQEAAAVITSLYKTAKQTGQYQPFKSYLEGLSAHQGPHQVALQKYIQTVGL